MSEKFTRDIRNVIINTYYREIMTVGAPPTPPSPPPNRRLKISTNNLREEKRPYRNWNDTARALCYSDKNRGVKSFRDRVSVYLTLRVARLLVRYLGRPVHSLGLSAAPHPRLTLVGGGESAVSRPSWPRPPPRPKTSRNRSPPDEF